METRERPIIFNSEMVRAILGGRKTQTRRVIKPQPPVECSIHYFLGNESWLNSKDREPYRHSWEAWSGELFRNRPNGHLCGHHEVKSHYGIPGDRLWVRENAQISPKHFGLSHETHKDDDGDYRIVSYCADYPGGRNEAADDYGIKITPSIHMPRWASRITLEVADIRVERVKNISEDDALQEGLSTGDWLGDPVGTFANLWDSINAKRGFSWESNPWVWVIEFKAVKK
ncbi:MAG: hypothetical protein HN929_02355 [Chloroflexi bacterium]|nr:hypothetical protein [Chloroflexota bacterium]